MNSLIKELIQPLLEEVTKTIALYPGKFKPPHKGHFEIAKSLLNKTDQVVIVVSHVPVDGITPQQSKAVWELYNDLLGNKLNIQIVDKSPVKYTLDIIKENPGKKLLFIGTSQDFPKDIPRSYTIDFLNGDRAFDIVSVGS